MKRRVIFVDDEPNILEGLRRMLRPMRRDWEMEFVESGPKALELLECKPFDVVVSDMRMPRMDGAQLLTEVMRRHPQTVRIILSGHSDREAILRSVGPTHQYLAKPCDAELLKNTVARACALRDLLSDESVKNVVSRIKSLPSLPTLYAEVIEAINSPDSTIDTIGQIISRDIAMTAKILQMVNSAFFGLPRKVSSPVQAVRLLGIDTVKALVLSVQVFSQFQEGALAGLELEALWEHSKSVAAFSRRIAQEEEAEQTTVDECLLAGLLHDLGMLVMAVNMPEHYFQAIAVAIDQKIPLHEAESMTFGATHAEIGAYLLGLWGFHERVIEALAFHHNPAKALGDAFCPLTAVHFADYVHLKLTEGSYQYSKPQIDMSYLAQLGLQSRLKTWTESCIRQSSEGEPE